MHDANIDASGSFFASLTKRNWIPAALLLILVIGAYFRFTGVNWDQDQHQQPDERFMTMVAGQIRPVAGLAQYFDTEQSTLNPLGHGFYTYGMLPLFLTRYVAEWLQQTEYNQVVLVGRALSGFFDLAVVVAVYLLGARLYRRRVGLLAAGLYAATVLPIQLAHFFAVDSFTTVFVVAAFYIAVLIMEGHQYWTYALFGVFTGLAMATKVSIAPLAGIVVLAGLAYVLEARADSKERKARLKSVLVGWVVAGLLTAIVFRIGQPYAFSGPGFFGLGLNPRWLEIIRTVSDQVAGRADFPPNHHWAGRPFSYGWTNMVRWGMGLPLGLVATFAWGWAAWRLWKGEWRRHLLLVVWVGAFFIWQSINFWRYTRYYLPIYPFAILLAAWALFEIYDHAQNWQITKQRPALAGRIAMVLLLGVLVTTYAYAFTFTRIYTRPHTRVAASRWMLENLPGPINLVVETTSGSHQIPLPIPADLELEQAEPWTASFTPQKSGTVSQINVPDIRPVESETSTSTLQFSLGLGDPNPELLAAVEEILRFDESTAEGKYAHTFEIPAVEVEAGNTYTLTLNALEGSSLSFPGVAIAKETGWDDSLPLIIDGVVPYPEVFRDLDLALHEPDTEAKRELMLDVLDRADYIVIASNRAYDAMPRLPLRFPMTLAFYQALFGCDSQLVASCAYPATAPFTGELGFDLIATFESHPNLGPIAFPDQEAQESFTVYDHPKVMVFEKSPEFSLTDARLVLESVDLIQIIDQSAKQVSKAPTGLRLPATRLSEQKAAGTWTEISSYYLFQNQYQILGVIAWYALLLIVGWIAFPLTFFAFQGLSDRGYTFSRLVGLLIIAWLAWFSSSLQIAPFTRGSLWLFLILVSAIAGGIAWRQRVNLLEFVRERWRYLLVIEGLFLAMFLFVLILRWNNPDLWHPYTGGEKPGDFALFNAVLKTRSFPPYDPWLAGHYVNYYYYGYVLSAIPTKLLSIVPGVAYNLLIPLWFALTGIGVFGITYNLVAGRPSLTNSATSASADSKYPYLAGGIAVAFMALLGNLFQFRMLWERLQQITPSQIENPNFLEQLGGVLTGTQQILTGKASLLAGYKGSWYFDASRAILNGQQAAPITEFPYFTFLYADLHPHMMDMAIVLAGMGWLLSFIRSPQLITSPFNLQRALTIGTTWLIGGLILGATYPTNTWDFPVLAVLGVVAVGYAGWSQRGSDTQTTVLHMTLNIGLLLLLALGLYAPFRQWFATGDQTPMLWQGPRTPFSDYLTVHGLFLFLLITFLTLETVLWLRPKIKSFIHTPLGQLVPAIKWGGALLLGGVIITLVGFLWSWQNDYQAVVFALLLAIWTGLLLLRRGQTLEQRVVLALIGAGVGLTLIAELVALKGDVGRMNVVFKTYLLVWIFFSIAAAVALVWVIPHLRSGKWRWIWWGILGSLVIAASAFTVVGTLAKVQDRWPGIANPPRTLDGLAYMLGENIQDPDAPGSAVYNDEGSPLQLARDWQAIRWMQENISGTPTIVEGHSTEYRWGSRFSVYTGLPTVVGWSWHLRQHNAVLPPSVVEKRIEAVHNFYNTPNRSEAIEFLRRYQVDYIVVGELERAHYTVEGLEKFEQMAVDGDLEAVYPPAANGNEVRIYAVQLDQ